jgi:hypothetical protein
LIPHEASLEEIVEVKVYHTVYGKVCGTTELKTEEARNAIFILVMSTCENRIKYFGS